MGDRYEDAVLAFSHNLGVNRTLLQAYGTVDRLDNRRNAYVGRHRAGSDIFRSSSGHPLGRRGPVTCGALSVLIVRALA